MQTVFNPSSSSSGSKSVIVYFSDKSVSNSYKVGQRIADKGLVCVVSNNPSNCDHENSNHIWFVFVLVSILILSIMTSNTVRQMSLVAVYSYLVFCIVLIYNKCYSNKETTYFDVNAELDSSIKVVEWVQSNIPSANDGVYLMGCGKRGYIVTMLSTNSHLLNEQVVINGVISINGFYSDINNSSLHENFGKRTQYYDAFPIYNVNLSTPPTLLINSGNVEEMRRQSRDYHYVLMQYGTFVESVYFDDCLPTDICLSWRKGGVNSRVPDNIMRFIQTVEQAKITSDS